MYVTSLLDNVTLLGIILNLNVDSIRLLKQPLTCYEFNSA